MLRLILLLLSILPTNSLALTNALPLVAHPDIVRIRLANGWVCSGVFIDPYTVLTAAHCVKVQADEKFLAETYLEGEDDQKLNVKIKKLTPHPGYRGQFWHYADVGIIKTSENLNFKNEFSLESDLANISNKAQLFGCGRTLSKVDVYKRTTGVNTFLQIGAVLFSLEKQKILKIPEKLSVSQKMIPAGQSQIFLLIKLLVFIRLAVSISLLLLGFLRQVRGLQL